MAGYLGTKAVFLSTTAASVTGNSTITGDLTVDTNTLYVDSTNNRVGIGTSSPSGASGTALEVNGGAGQARLVLKNNTTGSASTDGSQIALVGSQLVIQNRENSETTFETNGSERMRIDASGNLLVGTTTLPSAGSGGVGFQPTTAARTIIRCSSSATTNAGLVIFQNPNGEVGYISTNGSSTSYSTSSDYRLKEDWQPMTGASERVLALNPVNFAWKADGSRVDGFLAHEAQEVVPEAVTGTKDAMRDEEYEVTPAVYEDVVIPAVLDAEGNEVEPERTEQRLVSEAVMGTRSVPDYQGIDQSKLVPLLTAALQEALTEIADLKARVTALETV